MDVKGKATQRDCECLSTFLEVSLNDVENLKELVQNTVPGYRSRRQVWLMCKHHLLFLWGRLCCCDECFDSTAVNSESKN